MRIAIFGLGSIGTRHLRNLLECGENDMMVCEAPLTGTSDIPNLVFFTRDHKAVWAWHPEAVLICTPPASHYEIAIEALRHGCHVFCEKPLAITVEMAKDILKFAENDNKVLAIGYQLRWQLSEQFRATALAENLVWVCRQDMRQWPSHYQKDILEEFSHELDAAVFVNGPVEALTASRNEETWGIQLRHIDSLSLIRLEAQAEMAQREAWGVCGARWQFDAAAFNDQAYKDELRAFLKACRGEGWDERLCNGAEAVHVCKIIEACRESARHCSVVRLS